MKKVLVVYATKSGCTTGIAEQIGRALTERGADVDVFSVAEAPAPAGYDAVIVGSGIRMGQWLEAARDWVGASVQALSAMPVAFFTCCLTLAQEPAKAGEVRAYTDALIESCGLTPIDVGLFAGWNEPRRFGLLERTILKAMKAPVGDFRDLAAVAAWTDAVAPELGME